MMGFMSLRRSSADKLIVKAGEGEIVGDAPDRRVEILSDAGEVNATWSRFGPGRDGADLHIHYEHTDCFYVLDGELTMRLGPQGEEVRAPVGTFVRVPRGVVHGFRNSSDAEMRYLNLHAPGRRFTDYMRAMRDGERFDYDQFDPPADGGRPHTEAVIGEREVLIDVPGITVALLADVEDLAVAEITGTAPAVPLHVHERHVESFFVVEGSLTLTAGDEVVQAQAGDWLQVPEGVPHTFTAEGRWLDIHAPGSGFGGFLRALVAGEADAIGASGFDQVNLG